MLKLAIKIERSRLNSALKAVGNDYFTGDESGMPRAQLGWHPYLVRLFFSIPNL